MPAAAIILPLVETVVAPMVAPIVSSALAGTGVAALGTAAATQIATAALVGGGGNALIAAAQGQDVGKAALVGAITGGVGSAAAPIAGQVTQTALGNTAENVILGSTTIGDVTTGALSKGLAGAASAAAQGQDVLKGAEYGAAAGAVAPLVMGGIEAATGGGKPTYTDPTTGQTSVAQGPPSTPSLTGNKYIDAAILGGRVVGVNRPDQYAGAITPLISGTVGGIASGLAPETAFKRAIPGAIGGAISGEALYGLGLEPSISSALGQAGQQLAYYGLPATTIDRPQPSYPSYQAPPDPGLSMRGPAPSATLGQSLSIAPTLGYSPGLTVFGSGGEGDQPKKPVWNVASLRNIGSAEA